MIWSTLLFLAGLVAVSASFIDLFGIAEGAIAFGVGLMIMALFRFCYEIRIKRN